MVTDTLKQIAEEQHKVVMKARTTNLWLAGFGLILLLVTCALAWYWFGFRLVVVLFLFNWAINVEHSARISKRYLDRGRHLGL
jgi:hypothetical protein